MIGSYDKPKVRLPGCGGAAEIAVHAQRVLIISRLNPRAFPAEIDFITSPGQQCRGRSRRDLGMPGAGPIKVITDKGILESDPVTGEMILTGLYPGVTADEVKAAVGWPLRVRDTLDLLPPPDDRELDLLRNVLDPKKLYLG